MRSNIKLILLLAVGLLRQPAGGDTVELKNGTLLEGKYAGGTATTIRVETTRGIEVFPTTDVLALTFSSSPAAEKAATPAPAPPPAREAVATTRSTPASVIVPAGTLLVVRMESQVSSADEGKRFTARLVGDVKAGESVVARAGTLVYGQVEKSKRAGRLAGKSELHISLTGIDQSGSVLPIMTTNYAESGKGEFRNTARNTAAGAVVGHAIDDDGGGGKGALVGAGVSLIKKGDAVTVPSGALLEFRLSQPLHTTPL